MDMQTDAPTEAVETGVEEQPQAVAQPEPVEACTRVFVVGKRYPLLVEGDLTDTLKALQDDSAQAKRFSPVFRLVDRQTGLPEPGEAGLWSPNLDNVSGVQGAEVPKPHEVTFPHAQGAPDFPEY